MAWADLLRFVKIAKKIKIDVLDGSKSCEIEVFCHLRPCDAEAYLEPSQTSIWWSCFAKIVNSF